MALLIVASFFFPKAEVVAQRDVARPVIRIASDRVGPPRVDLDTSRQTVVVAAPVPYPQPQAPVRKAEAQLVAPLPTPAAPVKIERKNTKIAKRFDHQRMAANPQVFQPFHLTW